MTLAPDPIRAHERKCEVCKRREWCDTVMDLIANERGHATYAELLEWTACYRAQQPELPLEAR